MKNSVYLVLAFLFIMAKPAFAAEKEHEIKNNTAVFEEIAVEVKKRVDRLEEIKATDFGELTSSEKKELRKELRTINKELKSLGKADSEARSQAEATAKGSQTGIYISGSAIIIILLILLLL